MLQLFLPYHLATRSPLESEATFCTGRLGRPIAFTTEEKVTQFIEAARMRLGLTLYWGVASELEFPGLDQTQNLDLDPALPEVLLLEQLVSSTLFVHT